MMNVALRGDGTLPEEFKVFSEDKGNENFQHELRTANESLLLNALGDIVEMSIKASSFCKSLVPGEYIPEAEEGLTGADLKLDTRQIPTILAKRFQEPEYLFLANHGSIEAGCYLKIEDWK